MTLKVGIENLEADSQTPIGRGLPARVGSVLKEGIEMVNQSDWRTAGTFGSFLQQLGDALGPSGHRGMRGPFRQLLAGLYTGLIGVWSLAATATAVAVDFESEIRPLLEKHCLSCHGPERAESQLRLDTRQRILRGGDSGEPAVVPGEVAKSYLLTRVLHEDPAERMPPDKPPLQADEIALLRNWVNDLSAWPQQDSMSELEVGSHWSFQPIRHGPFPVGERHPIDGFVQARLSQDQLSLGPEASRETRIRRLYLIMHGLPPTPAQVDRFVSDTRADAWERLVEEVLASPRFGERAATFWLDLVHFGETHGFETNRERPNAWPYRDYVIETFNQDKPYNQFVQEQLAGDVLGADAATGFLVAGPFDLVKGQDPLLRLMQRQDELADIINTTGTAFLGLTVGCARCHNHKFDPIAQTDYYALQAICAGVQHADRKLPLSASAEQRVAALDQEVTSLREKLARFIAPESLPGTGTRPAVEPRYNQETFPATPVRWVRFTILNTNQGQPCLDELEVFSGEQNVALAAHGAKASSSGDFVHPLHKLAHINDGHYGNEHSWIAAQTQGGWVQLELPAELPVQRIVWARDRTGKYADRLATEYRIEGSLDGKEWKLLASSQDRMPFSPQQPKPVTYRFTGVSEAVATEGKNGLARLERLLTERAAISRTSEVYAGTFGAPGTVHRLYRGDPTTPREAVSPGAIRALANLKLTDETSESERRKALARWITEPNNPLAARVMVNRIWQFHFGTGLVDTPSDLGRNGTQPTHPELLDWLAAEFIQRDWSCKQIHRLILTSRTWQQSSRPQDAALAVDAASRLWWRFPPRRLEAEAIRDSMLAVSGVLDERMGGPGFSAFEIQMENVRHYFPKADFGPTDWRRMVYMTRVRQERDAIFGAFDCPDFSQVVPQRSRSTTPLQALNLLNSRFVLQQAERFASRLEQAESDPGARVQLAFRLCFGRSAEPDELHEALEFIRLTNWSQFTRALLNANEFVTIP